MPAILVRGKAHPFAERGSVFVSAFDGKELIAKFWGKLHKRLDQIPPMSYSLLFEHQSRKYDALPSPEALWASERAELKVVLPSKS